MGVKRKNKHSFLIGKFYITTLVLLSFLSRDSFASDQFRQYFSAEYAIAFDYPADWIEKPPRGNDQVIAKVSSNRADKATCYVEIKPTKVDQSLDEFTSDRFAEIKKRFPETTLLQQTTLDEPWKGTLLHVRIQYENFDQLESIENIRLFLLRADQQIGLVCGAMSWAMQSNEGRLRKQLFDVVESLELLEQKQEKKRTEN